MAHDELPAMLRQTLADRKVSRGEKRALKQVLLDADLDGRQLARLRSEAFELAREKLFETDARRTLDWLEDTLKLLAEAAPARPSADDEAWFAPGDNLAGRLAELLRGARRSMDICVFTITDDRISRAIRAAHQRGLAVRIITDDQKVFDRGSDVDELCDAGVPVRIDRSPFHMHHKFVILDGTRLINGSYNWTRSAGGGNYENFILSHSPSLVRRFAQTFEQLWQAFE